MQWYRWGIVGLGLILAAAPTARAGAPDDALALADKIDDQLSARWVAERITAADPADDAVWLRRVWLDVAGKIPPASEVRRFLKDTSPDKRRKVVADLLESSGYVTNFANVWRSALLPEVDSNPNLAYLSLGFDAWLTKHLTDNTPYDKMVRELLTVPIGNDGQRYSNVYGDANQESPLSFYVAKEFKPENLAASTSRLFLGVRIECAQCHDHPFATWKRDQFWGTAAFFAGIQGRGQDGYFNVVKELRDRRELPIPGTDRTAQASFLDGSEPKWKYKQGARAALADWVTARDNPFFARATVNRVWGHFYGVGLVEPVDDFKDTNPPSHPALLDELARQFVAHDYDLKFLVRAITATKSYALSSEVADPTQDNPRLFAHVSVKGLSPDQLFDSFSQATGYVDPNPRAQRLYGFGTPRYDLLSKFSHQDHPTEFQMSIPQALGMMNSRLVSEATTADKGKTLGAVADAPFLDTAGKIEALYLAALSRKPTPEESAKLVAYVNKGGPKGDPKRALGDVFWALLNSSEFILNH
jgi:hypothetical protein